MKKFTYIFLLCLACMFCGCSSEKIRTDAHQWSLNVKISDVYGLGNGGSGAGEGISTKISYSGDYGEHSEFELGDYFGLFVLEAPDNIIVKNLKVYCSGLDNQGQTVWSIFKKGASDDHTSNYPISDILSKGVGYFAYYPYDESYSKTISDVASIKSIVSNAYALLPSDQSASYTNLDLLVASNLEDCVFGEVHLSDKQVSLTFAHVMAMLRYFIPSGAIKYEYTFCGADFTPHLMGSAEGLDEFRYLFKPGCVLDVCVKFVKDKKLYKFETGNSKNIWPIATQAGHCYFLDENAPKVPYETAVDMGTSVMWASFNIGAEDDETATAENIGGIAGNYFMWGANQTTSSFGSSSYANYNKNFTAGTKPNELPLGYDYSGDAIYDAARNVWGGKWRTPSWEEWQELYNACTYKAEAGKLTLTSKTTGNTLVFPFQGFNNGTTVSQPHNGFYWSSTANPSNIAKALSTNFRSGNAPTQNSSADRYTGLPIRPVYSQHH